jgi:serine/threonine protein kinase
MHGKKVIHRDLKPENLVLDDKGYVRITDLGVSREVIANNAEDTSGTPGYMAP